MIHPVIREIFEDLARRPALQELVRVLNAQQPGPWSLTGLTQTAKALIAVLLWRATERPVIVVSANNGEAEAIYESIQAFFELVAAGPKQPRPLLLPGLDVLPHQHIAPHAELMEKRAVALWRLASGSVPIVVAPVGAALMRMEPPAFYRNLAVTLEVDEEIPFSDLIEHIRSVGYEHREPVEMVGEFSVRGGILDIFSPEHERPVRVEFFGDLVESIRHFEVATQRSVLKLDHFAVLPLSEYPSTPRLIDEIRERLEVDEAAWMHGPPQGWEFLLPLIRPREHSLFELTPRTAILLDESRDVVAASNRLWTRLEDGRGHAAVEPEAHYFTWEQLLERVPSTPRLSLNELDLGATAGSLTFPSRPALSFGGNIPIAISEARSLVEKGNQVVFFAASNGEVERLSDVLKEYSVPFQLGLRREEGTPDYLAERSYVAGPVSQTLVLKSALRRGVIFPEDRIAFFGYEDLFGEAYSGPRVHEPKSHLKTFSSDLSDLQPGDYVVHVEHGVGKFLGIKQLAAGEQSGDYMQLEYAGEAKLYVPLTRADLVQKFRGAGDTKPSLDRMGGATWTRTKSKIKARMRDMAEELVKLYAQRKLTPGFAFSPDSNWQREFEEAFEYQETEDQLTAISDIKRDMETETPMDRLLCGDVGFGKTEVAMRAAFKALGDGKQVAVLAPTTVLSFQHFETFSRRFKPFPVRVELLSRFRNKDEIKQILEDLAAAKVDIVTGTHRILSEDVNFADLGLLIVDEEQRFGVRHKERLKQMRKNVDVLTMTATPIPRTLHMSLLGLRDMSVIETPPKDRLAIQTRVLEFDIDLVKHAIETELAREGQVYFIHNRVESIWERAGQIQQLVPDCRVAVGHGQMGETALEKVTLGFMRHEFDVFVATTIVENGLDIPLANTIIIDNAQLYGLSQLYQLRGRVGRSDRPAYAYLLVPKDVELSDVARKRLAALKEFSDLGAGFKIAALDLELRGAGNLLGGEQHGHINAIGFDMYVRMLEEAIRELKGEEIAPEVHTRFALGLDIRIPTTYIVDEHQRLRAYKRIADLQTESAAAEIRAELADRYGALPDEVALLISFSLLKSAAEQVGIESVEKKDGALLLKFHPESQVDPQKLMQLVASTPSAQFTPAGVLRLPLVRASAPAQVIDSLHAGIVQLRA